MVMAVLAVLPMLSLPGRQNLGRTTWEGQGELGRDRLWPYIHVSGATHTLSMTIWSVDISRQIIPVRKIKKLFHANSAYDDSDTNGCNLATRDQFTYWLWDILILNQGRSLTSTEYMRDDPEQLGWKLPHFRESINTMDDYVFVDPNICVRWREIKSSAGALSSHARRKKSINNKWRFWKGSFIDGCSYRGLVAGCYINIISVKYPSTSFSLRIYLR